MAIKSLKRSSLLDNVFYRSMLAGNEGFEPEDEFLLEEVVLPSSAASVTFSDLGAYASEYQHLQIRYAVRSGLADVVDEIFIYLNGDTGSNYSNHYLRGNGSVAQSGANTNHSRLYEWGISITGNNAPANAFGAGVLDILDPFETTKNTTTRLLGGSMYTASAGYVGLISGSWRNTAALTSIEFDLPSSSFLTGSRFSLYGSK